MSIFSSILRTAYKLSGAKKAFGLPEDEKNWREKAKDVKKRFAQEERKEAQEEASAQHRVRLRADPRTGGIFRLARARKSGVPEVFGLATHFVERQRVARASHAVRHDASFGDAVREELSLSSA